MSAELYLKHFGLEEPPFRLTPATRFLYLGESMREALNTACLGLDSGDAFLKITGQVGLGKTLVCRELLNRLEAPFETAYIPNPRLPPEELLSAIARELAIEPQPGSPGTHHLMSRIQDRLLERAAAGARVVLLLDEAQTMPDETVETVRLLTNLESASERLLQLVLLGQPELDQRLAAHHLRQIRSRITHACTLQPLGHHEVSDYLRFRQIVAGRHSGDLFTAAGARRLARHSRGVPRLLNLLAHKALLDAFGHGDSRVGRGHARRAALDTDEARKDSPALPWIAAAIAGSAAGAGLWYSGLFA